MCQADLELSQMDNEDPPGRKLVSQIKPLFHE